MDEQYETINFEKIREAFYVYCDIIIRHGKGTERTPLSSFYIGCVILNSIACEIGLKALLAYENNFSHGHDLYELFHKLSPQTQMIIKQCISYEEDSFNEALLDSKNNFIKWRYYYESAHLPANYEFIFRLFSAIKAILDMTKPEA